MAPLAARMVGPVNGLADDVLSTATFEDGSLMVAYTRNIDTTQFVRIAVSRPGDTSPFPEEQAVCFEGGSVSCRHAWLNNCAGVPSILSLVQDDMTPPFHLRLTRRPTGIFSGSTITRAAGLAAPLGMACDASGLANLFYRDGTQLQHATWNGSMLGAPLPVANNVTQLAAAVDPQGVPWVVTLDTSSVARLHGAASGSWSEETLQATNARSSVDLVISPLGDFHVCLQDFSSDHAVLVYLRGRPGALVRETVATGVDVEQPGSRCRLALGQDGSVFLSHVTAPGGHVLLSRRNPTRGTWGTDEVDATTPGLGPQDVAVDAQGALHVLYVTAAGRLRWAH